MAHEIDFIPVGNGERSGDAIVVRWKELSGWKIGVIDGGSKESGQKIVDHINQYYGKNQVIEFALNTHPDMDHCSGLTVVLENLPVKKLWIHQPWNYSQDLLHLIDDGRVTDDSLEQRLRERLSMAHELEKLAIKLKIPIEEPFQGKRVGPFTVLSPSCEQYKELVCKFREMPSTKNSFMDRLFKTAAKALDWVLESPDHETLRDGGVTSAENESSVILYGQLDDRKVLLTGDAGLEALKNAADYADLMFPSWKPLGLIQIPHHGSRNNVSPEILDRILGTRMSDEGHRGKAIACASSGSTTHPRKAVLNAFRRRGYKCSSTQGNTVCFHSADIPSRDGWVPVKHFEHFNQVEAYD